MSALRPLLVAAGVLLLVALVMLGVRSGDDTATPSADDLPPPTPTVAQPGGTDDLTEDPAGSPSPSPTAGEASPTDAATGGTGPTEEPTSGPGDTSTGGTGTDASDDGTAPDDGTASDDDGAAGEDGSAADEGEGEDGEDDRQVVAMGESGDEDVDDMPDTGGGPAAMLGGALVLAAGTTLGRRR